MLNFWESLFHNEIYLKMKDFALTAFLGAGKIIINSVFEGECKREIPNAKYKEIAVSWNNAFEEH